MIKMRAPVGMSAIGFGISQVEVGEDGSALIHPNDAASAASHGFTPWDAPAPVGDIEGMTRAQLIEHMISVARAEMAKISDEELRNAARARLRHIEHEQEPLRRPMPPAPPVDEPQPLTPDQIQSLRFKLPDMPREDMQNFLRSRRVAFAGATGDPRLREMVSAEITRSAAAE